MVKLQIRQVNIDVPNEIAVISDNGPNCDYQYIMKEPAEKFERKLTCLGENTKTYITFSVPIKRKLKELVETELI